MEEEIFDSLNHVGYTALNEAELSKALNQGCKYVPFTKLVEWLTKEIQYLLSLDEHVNAISSAADTSSFLMELNSFLRETECQYSVLTTGNLNSRLDSKENRILLISYLLDELMAARMIKASKPDDDSMDVMVNESDVACNLNETLKTLQIDKPPDNITPAALFSKIEEKLKMAISKAPPELLSKPCIVARLSPAQWDLLNDFNNKLKSEYTARKETLLKRLDVTLQSFKWSDRLKVKSSEIDRSYADERIKLRSVPAVSVADILAAREDIAILEKTSSASVRSKTKSDVNKVLIGMVPDRGGRPYETEPPPPEMPKWANRTSNRDSSAGRGRGSNRSRGQFRGGGAPGGRNDNLDSVSAPQETDPMHAQGKFRVQSGWSHQAQLQHQGITYQSGIKTNQAGGNNENGSSSAYSRGGSGYDNRGGSGYDNRGGSGYGNRGGSGYGNRGGSGYENRGYDNRGGSGYDKCGDTGYNNRGGSGYENRGGSGYDNYGGSGYDNRGGSGYENRGGSGYGHRGYPNRGGYGRR